MKLPGRLACLLLLGLVAPTGLTEGRLQDFVVKDVNLEGRELSDNVTPVKYFLKFDLRAASDSQPLPDVYTGYVEIDVNFSGRTKSNKKGLLNQLGACVGAGRSRPGESHNEILLHADKSVEIEAVQVKVNDEEMKVAKVGRDTKEQLIYIKLAGKLPKEDSTGQIRLLFTGKVRRDHKGISLTSEQVGNQTYQKIVANFEPNFARLATPCFDEPRFRAKIDLRLMHSYIFRSAANTELEYHFMADAHNMLSIFKPTHPIPLDKMSFVIGEFGEPDRPSGGLPAVTTSDNVVLRYLSLPGASHRGRELLDVAQKAYDWMRAYTKSRIPMHKLDIVPTTDAGMDQTAAWGLVFYRDAPTVTVGERTIKVGPIETALSVAELVAEQWFGNLLSVRDWNDLWVTDAIAAQLALDFVTETYPEYKSQVNVDETTFASPGAAKLGEPKSLSDKLDASQSSLDSHTERSLVKSIKFAKYLQSMKPGELQSAVRSVVAKYSYKSVDIPEALAAFNYPVPE